VRVFNRQRTGITTVGEVPTAEKGRIRAVDPQFWEKNLDELSG
jgi:hypothetical protein